MHTYRVILTKTESWAIDLPAESCTEAQEIANDIRLELGFSNFEKYVEDEIEFVDCCRIPF